MGRRVAAERHVRAVLVVVANVLAQDSTQVVLSENDHVVDDVPTRASDPSFRETVLPWGARRRPELLQAEVVDAPIERGAEDRVAVADQPRDSGVGAHSLDDLLRRPLGGRVRGDVHVDYAATLERRDEERVQDANATVGTVKKSTAIAPIMWLRTNVPHVCEGGHAGRSDGFGMYRATASFPTS